MPLKNDVNKNAKADAKIDAKIDTKTSAKPNANKNPKKESAIEDLYKKYTHHQHILELSDTYIGGKEPDNRNMWVYDFDLKKIVRKTIVYIPGLYKIFDEILVNARDHCIRDPTCKIIKITIDKTTNIITVWNDGNGIPIEIHKEHNMYLPELIFGNLLTSSNYEVKGKIVGGKNGYGAKLTNIFSTEFEIDTVDSKKAKKYVQKFTNNMYDKTEPIITASKSKSYTKISFKPDLKRFNIDTLSDDMNTLFHKRAYDLAACTADNKVKVYLNDELINLKSFEEYIAMFCTNDELASQAIYETISNRWKIGIMYNPDVGFRHISYVNGVCTFEGGTHVTYITDQIIAKITDVIKSKDKTLKIKPQYIKENLTVFVDCAIEDPSFGSQTKETLLNKVADFGSKCELTNTIIQKLIKNCDIIEDIMKIAELKQNSALTKSDGKKVKSLKGIVKLEDAKWAGTGKSQSTRLILTEGDSAFAFAIAGMSVIGRDRYGAFPLKGKLLNVREASLDQLAKNEEIINIKKIMGLKQKTNYTDTKQLRYGGIIILTDQDHDGSHIKGLLMNFIHFFWPSLAKLDGFIQSIATPIIKAFKTSDVKRLNPKIFYTINDYNTWLNVTGSAGWITKYYKGLGTSGDEEAKEVFNDFDKKIISYIWDNVNPVVDSELVPEDVSSEKENKENTDDDITDVSDNESNDDVQVNDYTSKCYDSITLAFSKTRANDRKIWLKSYKHDLGLDNTQQKILYSDFVNKELIHFSNYDNIRSIPSICDGFKPSQRKTLYGSLLKKIEKIKDEIKVAQLAAYISEKTEYHHGEVSLQGTIINMAQNFVSSNNINLLVPSGNFGYRYKGGDEAASARYIFTYINELTPLIFRKEDEQIYKHIVEDGTVIEPEWFAPIIPQLLVNGAKGIGTGYSTFIPCYNPKDIIDNLNALMNKQKLKPMMPYYKGFKGQITKINDCSFQTRGVYEIVNETTIKITELPINVWTDTYKKFLETIVIDDTKKVEKNGKKKAPKLQFIDSYFIDGGNNDIKIEIYFPDGNLQQLLKNGQLEKQLKLTNTLSTSNMHLYNYDKTITKYLTPEDILLDFYKFRLNVYILRKERHIQQLKNTLNILMYKKKFMEYYFDDTIIVYNHKTKKSRKETDVVADLIKFNFPKLSSNIETDKNHKSYSYITNITIFALTEEKLEELDEEIKKKKKDIDDYEKIPVETIWKQELNEFSVGYEKWLADQSTDVKKVKKQKPAKNVEKQKLVKKNN